MQVGSNGKGFSEYVPQAGMFEVTLAWYLTNQILQNLDGSSNTFSFLMALGHVAFIFPNRIRCPGCNGTYYCDGLSLRIFDEISSIVRVGFGFYHSPFNKRP